MKRRSNVWFYILVLLICFSGGIITGKLVIDWSYFEVSKEFRVIDALNLVVTIGLGIYIAWTLERKKQRDRAEKDIITTKILEIEENIILMLSILDEEKIKYPQINSMIHRLGIIRNSLFKELNSLNFKLKSQSSDGILEDEIKEEHGKLKRLLTETPIKQDGETEIKVIKNIVAYTDKRKLEIISSAYTLKEKFFVLKMTLNRL